MGENSGIEWTTHTFNPWIGCTAVSPACDHCYAETLATTRLGVGWGPHAERRRTKPSTWNQPLAWNRKAEREGRRDRVFCASLADVFDNQVPEQWRADLWEMIAATPHLDWLLLTKRPQNIGKMLPPAWKGGWPNVWLGTTVENQAEADRRIPHLLAAPAAKRFLSMEPLLGRVDLNRISHGAEMWTDALSGLAYYGPGSAPIRTRIDWVIAGGESGPKARPSHPDWFRSLRGQCQAAGTAFFFKQWGEWRPICQGESDWYRHLYRSNVQAKDGEDQEALDEVRGKRCIVDQLCLRNDGDHTGITEPNAWLQGTRPVLAFKTGKKAAGAMLDGREWREVPA